MHRKIIGILICMLLIGTVLPASGTLIIDKTTSSNISGNTLYVGGTGEGNYSSIQDAIDNASDEDTVFVYDYSSPYYEHVVVNKSINLIGEDKDTTIIDGSESGDVVNISADWVNISGFTIQNSGNEYEYYAGIRTHSQYNNISGNTISNNLIVGIWLIDSSSNTITGNTISNNNGIGIYLDVSSSNTITDNTFSSNNLFSIHLVYSSSNTITGNTITSNNADGIVIWFSSSNTITGNTISNNNGIGIYLRGHSNNIITGNTISNNNGVGIYLEHSSSNIITGNTITSNNLSGIVLWNECSSNTIIGNKISNNGYGYYGGDGISLYDSNSNIIYHNNFIDNEENAYDEGENIWDDGEYGNYWDNYKERYPFARRNLLKPWMWNTPYEIPGGNNKDMCPLIKQWPNSKPRTISRNTALFDSMFMRFSNLFPILQMLLQRLGTTIKV